MLLQIVGVGRAGPVDEVEVDIVQAKALKGRVNALLNAVVPGVVQLGGDPDLTARDAGVSDAVTNLGLIAICKSAMPVNTNPIVPTVATHVSM